MRRKGKQHAIPSLLVQRAAAAQLLAWVCGSPLMRLLPIMVFCVLQHEISCSDLSHCLVRSENAFIQKSCSFLNNVTAPVLDCILNLARRWVQGSCCPFTRSWCQLGSWHWGPKAHPRPWDIPCQGSRCHNFRNLPFISIPQVVTGSLTNIRHCGFTNKPKCFQWPLSFKEDWKSDAGSLGCSQPLSFFQKGDSGLGWHILDLQVGLTTISSQLQLQLPTSLL